VKNAENAIFGGSPPTRPAELLRRELRNIIAKQNEPLMLIF
jgi:hypothetical protein